MKLKKCITFVFLIAISTLGLIIGNNISLYQNKCVLIHTRKDKFYGTFAKELKKQLSLSGYKFNCPSIFKKTVIDFVYTGKTYWQNRYEKRKKDVNIALVGDCFTAYDIDFLKEYDYILSVGEYRFGYLAMFNFKALYFPIHKDKSQTLCQIDYYNAKVDIKNVASRLDDIIQRAGYEKK